MIHIRVVHAGGANFPQARDGFGREYVIEFHDQQHKHKILLHLRNPPVDRFVAFEAALIAREQHLHIRPQLEAVHPSDQPHAQQRHQHRPKPEWIEIEFTLRRRHGGSSTMRKRPTRLFFPN